MDIQVISIGNFDEMAMTFKARFSLKLTWFDWRVQYFNLKNMTENLNYLSNKDIKDIWLPKLIFSNSIEEIILKFDEISSVIVQRLGKPDGDDVILLMTVILAFFFGDIFNIPSMRFLFYFLRLGKSFKSIKLGRKNTKSGKGHVLINIFR